MHENTKNAKLKSGFKFFCALLVIPDKYAGKTLGNEASIGVSVKLRMGTNLLATHIND